MQRIFAVPFSLTACLDETLPLDGIQIHSESIVYTSKFIPN